jgi:oligoribonuclease NrnB/cAMP/cGMP phosphodiesterase (DHH superfamily)
MKKLCIYHGNCADGFTAAWALWKKYPDTDFHAGIYYADPPDCSGRDVVLLDFSFKRPILLEMAKKAKSILILDHHKTALEDLVDLPDNVTTIFDMSKSGAMLAWEYFHSNEEPPTLVKYVQDRDLWRFKLENTRPFQANLFSYEYTFENWDNVNTLCNNPDTLSSFIKEGEAIERKHFKDIRELISVAKTRSVIAGFNIPILNCPYFQSSDAGHIMAEGEPFSACYYIKEDTIVYSLRSSEQGIDVSKVAALFGGGGHKAAAGFSIKLSDFYLLEEKKLNETSN